MLYSVLRALARCAYSLLFRIEVRGDRALPEGGSLVVANHTSAWDPPLIGIVFPRHMRFMAKAELFRIPALRTLLKVVGAYPIKRDNADGSALRVTVRLLKAGWPISVFPEGTRKGATERAGRPGKARRGVAFLAWTAEVPIVPVAIRGHYGIRGRVVVQIGRPIRLPKEKDRPSRERMAEIVDKEVMGRIRSLWDEAV